MEHLTVRSQLLALLRERAVLHGDFILASGKRSSLYLDARVVTLSAEGSHLVARAFLQELDDARVEGVAGLAIGADPIVASIAAISGQTAHPLDGFIVRAQRKDHGVRRRIEGPWRPGVRVAIVEDTSTTGGSALQAAAAVEEASGEVCGVYVLIDRHQGAQAAVEGAGYGFRALFSAEEVLS